ncbi:MAG: hypothetical protein V3V60_15875 [Sphingomonas aquatilis]|uniref:hypothetical protein n=1 Tax=Sphingomonas aquatilis TaxID=93063 RepID=UPI002F2D490F
MDGILDLGGPETLVVFGVHIKIMSALFGLIGCGVGHVIAPRAAEPLGLRRHIGVVFGGMMVAIAITIATGQNPLLVFGWSMGIGFAGITLFRGWAAQAAAASKTLGSAALDELTERLTARKDKA